MAFGSGCAPAGALGLGPAAARAVLPYFPVSKLSITCASKALAGALGLGGVVDDVASGGLVILDDYGVWEGCTKAVHEFLAATQSWFNDLQNWVDFNAAQGPLFDGGLSGEQWAQLGTSGTKLMIAG